MLSYATMTGRDMATTASDEALAIFDRDEFGTLYCSLPSTFGVPISGNILLSGLCQPGRHLEVEMLAEMGRMSCW